MGPSRLRQKWIEQFTQWAQSRTDIRSVFLIGSCGRTGQNAADEWSDVDVLFTTTKTANYTKSNSWMREIGPFWAGIIPPGETFGGLLPIHCGFSAYDGGLVAEYFILSEQRVRWTVQLIRLFNRLPALRQWLPESISTIGTDSGDLFRRGTRVLLDKDGFAEKFLQATISTPGPPTEKPSCTEFQNSIDDFWFGPPKAVADLCRGRLLPAMKGLELMRRHILKWMEWQARSRDQWHTDNVNYRTSNLKEWADPRVVTDLPNIYARFDEDDLWQKLFSMMKLAHWLAPETARLLGYDCNTPSQQIMDWVQECFDEETSPK